MIKKLILVSLFAFYGAIANAEDAIQSNISVYNEVKNVVVTVEPSVMPVYDFIDHELVEFVAVDVHRDGRFSVPAGYISDDSIGLGVRYELLKSNQVMNIPVLDSFFISPTVGVGLKDFSNVLSKPSSLTKDNFVIFAGIVGAKKFGPQGK